MDDNQQKAETSTKDHYYKPTGLKSRHSWIMLVEDEWFANLLALSQEDTNQSAENILQKTCLPQSTERVLLPWRQLFLMLIAHLSPQILGPLTQPKILLLWPY